MMATTDAGKKKKHSPQTRLIMAFVLVFAGPDATTGRGIPVGPGAGAPHARQNLSWSSTLLPQFAQKVLIFVFPRGLDLTGALKFARNILLCNRLRQCAKLVRPNLSVYPV